ncbi:hypothetical protein BRADI_1g53743v3 [Brachypodium distachyon]|uniref:Uncharacterized protein n=1 Tax=Brachypodium distachyon TaxID=15368 RepID=A0A2K2DR97_BRADI|nr:hypothetical protein BRADI_1g53743v3 [Brachypodium distachyon]
MLHARVVSNSREKHCLAKMMRVNCRPTMTSSPSSQGRKQSGKRKNVGRIFYFLRPTKNVSTKFECIYTPSHI